MLAAAPCSVFRNELQEKSDFGKFENDHLHFFISVFVLVDRSEEFL
jgi:hypothetical protein